MYNDLSGDASQGQQGNENQYKERPSQIAGSQRKGGLLSQAGLRPSMADPQKQNNTQGTFQQQPAQPTATPRQGGLLSRAAMPPAAPVEAPRQDSINAPSQVNWQMPPQTPRPMSQPPQTPRPMSQPPQPSSGVHSGNMASQPLNYARPSGGPSQPPTNWASTPLVAPNAGGPSQPPTNWASTPPRAPQSATSWSAVPPIPIINTGQLTAARTGALPPRQSHGFVGWFKNPDSGAKRGLTICLVLVLLLVGVGTIVQAATSQKGNQATPKTAARATANVHPTSTPTTTGVAPGATAAPAEGPNAFLFPTPAPVTKVTITAANATATAVAICPPVPAAYTNQVMVAPTNPYCFDFDTHVANVYTISNPPANFCIVMTANLPDGNFHCGAQFANQTGFVIVCNDGAWARAVNRSNVNTACSQDGGWKQDLITHTTLYV